MPIVGLTNQKPQFPQIGQLRKGKWLEEENRAIDLDHFRFTSDLPEVVEAFTAAYGEEPRLINVFLPHKTADENWEAWYEEYVKSGLVHRCDGEYIVRYRDKKDGTYVSPEPGSMKCPYCSGEKERTQKQGCNPQGRLQVVIRELGRLAYVMVITTSFNDVKNLDAQLRALEEIQGDLRGIPMLLRRRPEKISTPQMKKEDGQWVRTAERARRESWLLSIEAAPDWVDLQLEHQRIQALPDVPKRIEAEWQVVEGIAEPVEQEGDTVSLSGLDGEDIHGPASEPPPIEKPPEPEPVLLTLGEALGTALNREAPKLKLTKDDYLLKVVQLDAKDLIEYLTHSSSFQEPTFENLRLQEAAMVILSNWDDAREKVALKEALVEEEIEEVQVEEGDEHPLF